jgi:ArsR family transcriptional regulator
MDALLSALKAAAEPTRLRLLTLCAHCDLTVSELTQILGQSQPRVSRHLKLLCDAGLLERLREGSWAYFRLSSRGAVSEFARTLADAIPYDDPVLALDLERLEAILRARAERAADYFRRSAAQWDQIRSLYVDDAEVERRLVELLAQGQVRDLLDIGTGTGRMLEIFAPRVARAVGIDLSREMLAVARSKLESAKLRNCLVRHGDMYQLPLSSESFDAVTIHHVLHFAERPAQVVREAARVLRPSGRLIVVDFEAHALDFLREQHAHRWLGFKTDDVTGWCTAAGLEACAPIHLPGDPLNVAIWWAKRPPGAIQDSSGRLQ